MKTKFGAIALIIFILLAPVASANAAQPAASTAQDDMSRDLAQVGRLAIPTSEQCVQAEPQLIIDGFEEGIGDVTVNGATASQDKSSPIFDTCSMVLQLSGSSQASVRVNALNADPLKYTGVVVWVKPSTDGIKMTVGVIGKNGAFTSHSQTLRYSGEALPVYMDFASIGAMSQEIGAISTIILTFYPANGGTVELDNLALADASYGSFNQAWWDESDKNRFVDQRYQETLNDYLTLYTLKGKSDDYRTAVIRGIDNIILSRQPDGWVESKTTGLITAGTIGATLANAYMVFKDDPAMDENINVYGDDSHTRRWWIEKSLDMDVRFIDYIFTTNPNSWIVRNQLLEGARATYCTYLATGNGSYLNDYKNMIQTILAGRQDPIGTYPEWTNTYDPDTVMYDASYSAVQLSTLMSLAAMGDSEYAQPMAGDLFNVLQNVIDPGTGMIMNLNSSRKTYEGDLRWQDGMLYYLGTKEGIPGMVHLGYLENQVSPGKQFPDNFHSALARYYDLKYYVFPGADNQYKLPLECPIYSIDVLDVNGNIVSTLPASISGSGAVTNPSLSGRDPDTFVKVNGFMGSIQPQQDITVSFENGSVHIDGSGPVTVKYSSADLAIAPSQSAVSFTEVGGDGTKTVSKPIDSDGTLTYQANVNGDLELQTGTYVTPSIRPTTTSKPSSGPMTQGMYPIAVGIAVILLSCVSAFLLLKKKKT